MTCSSRFQVHAHAQRPASGARTRARPADLPRSGAGHAALLLACLLGSAGAVWAGCGDAPGAGVDWTECEKHRLVLRGADLTGARLAGVDFDATDLQGARLTGVDLTHASVDRARLSKADLSRGKLVQLNGYRANFSGANLTGADLSKAELFRANLSGANLSRATVRKAELQRANFEGANLDGANLTGADMARANLANTRLDGTRLAQARMFRTRLEGVDLSRTSGLTTPQLEIACGDARTRLPDGVKAPKSWPCGKDD
ncbi:MAG: pentapeptide repeat-containing protein [Rhodoferax sp.]|jgi:uncharacterized protein YjbI with pentapeptide repeats|nr:pentapeptide repeat-containing protein [Rhodoferax sp.]